MEASVARRTQPFVIVAAIAVTAFSLVGIGAIVGWIPTSVGSGGTVPAAQAPGPAEISEPEKAPVDAVKTEAPPQAATTAKRHSKPAAAPVPERLLTMPEPPQEAVPQVVPAPPPVVAAVCRECAVIEEVREIEKAGQASGAGAVGGAVVGGVLGHQVGSGRGRDVATVLGAVGGAVAGHQIEKNVKKTKEYQITVRYEDGSRGLFTQDTPPAWRPGDKVRIIDGAIRERG